MKISICIPTYNRSRYLNNCLESIISNKLTPNGDVEVCVSDNGSTDETESIVLAAQEQISIKYKKNSSNLGIPKNYLNVVEMADGEFVWLIGDDDLLLPSAVKKLLDLISKHPNVDFFFINSFQLATEYVTAFPQPFDTSNLPKNMIPCSSWPIRGEMMFMDLVNPKISFDFLGGMFLSVFKRKNWIQNANILNVKAISDLRTFSHFDNTFPHVKIFSKAFANSRAFFNARPLSVCLTGAREWSPMYPLVHSVRLVEALNEYRKNGLSYIKYLRCKNFALNNFIPDFVSMFIHKDRGYAYINPLKLILANCLFPNFFCSFFNVFIRKSKQIIAKRAVKSSGTQPN